MSELLMIAILIFGGLVLLYFGADWLVKGAVTISLKFGLSPLIVGLTVVALCETYPNSSKDEINQWVASCKGDSRKNKLINIWLK